MDVRVYLRLEGGAALATALVAYFELGGPLWLLAVLALAPDLSMLAYLGGPRTGALGYNVVHSYALPLGLGVAGLLVGEPLATQVAAVWAGHIGADRLFGYGLKSPEGFRHTHLGEMPAPDALTGR